MRHLLGTRLVPLLLASALGLAACSGGSGDGDGGASPSVEAPASSTSSAEGDGAGGGAKEPGSTPVPTTPDPTPTTPAPPEPTNAVAPEAQLDAGTVAEDAPVSIQGEGSATVNFYREGDFNAVAEFDCSQCTGPVELTGPERSTPFGVGTAPFEGGYLVEVFENDPPDQQLYVNATGPWSLTIQSWNDIEPSYGEIAGTGSAVLFLGDDMPGLDVWCQPVNGENCLMRGFSAVPDPETGAPQVRVFGGDEEMTHTVDLPMPGILSIRTNGEWRITPHS